jgi:hypothetical protein
MVQLSATRCSCIAILWVSLVSFVAITLCVASQRVFVVVSPYFVIDSVRKLLFTLSYVFIITIQDFYSAVDACAPWSKLSPLPSYHVGWSSSHVIRFPFCNMWVSLFLSLLELNYRPFSGSEAFAQKTVSFASRSHSYVTSAHVLLHRLHLTHMSQTRVYPKVSGLAA